MLRLGLTGGIATGKSTVCKMLQARNFTVIDADQVAHEVILKPSPCYSPIVARFGPGILDTQGEIDRKKLGSIVFEDAELLQRLNEIVHPEVIRQVLKRLDILEAERPETKVVVDASLMIECGFHKSFRFLVVVFCTASQQIKRLMARSGLSEDQARRRIALQMPLEQKVGLADYVIDNSGQLQETENQVDSLCETLSRMDCETD
jgi:dephospho-CoA kinase